jgi:HTH-type transcriptional regulator / antitoxin HigA
MAENQYSPTEVTPPGETLLEVLEERGITQAELSERTGRPRKTINEIVKGKSAITPETALQLERVLGVPAQFWNSRETQYREFLAQLEEQERLARSVAWIERFPTRQMMRHGLIPAQKDRLKILYSLLDFFGLASPEQWESVWENNALKGVAFRKARSSNRYALSAWLRGGQQVGEKSTCATYDAELFETTLGQIRRLTILPPAEFQPRLSELCGRCGVVVVFVRELTGSGASGATFWTLGHSRPVIMLSLRYKTDDHLWFTFFHEAAHILLHGKRGFFIEGLDSEDNREEEANRFAADFLIPQELLKRFLKRATRISLERISRFAQELGIAPGIVVGRLQHDRHLPLTHGNGLKRRLEWAERQP